MRPVAVVVCAALPLGLPMSFCLRLPTAKAIPANLQAKKAAAPALTLAVICLQTLTAPEPRTIKLLTLRLWSLKAA